ncbi:MAG: sulfatase-like hydrolase/transferase, partial [bacterium]|nr:sulfatase-like hydrolase/transferase [bacterium]
MKKRKPYHFLLWAGAALFIAAGVIVLFTGIPGSSVKSRVKAKLETDSGLNLLFITIDTMRDDHIGAYGYKEAQTPNLDRLANNGALFENCYSPVPVTLPAHSSIFTGKYPIAHHVRDNGSFFLDDSEITLAEKMKELDYDTYGVIASFVLLSKFGINQGFDGYDDSLSGDQLINSFDSEIKAEQVYGKFAKWFDNRDKERNFFAWVHFYDPHTPYNAPAEYSNEFGTDLQGRYDAEVAYTDFYIGKLIARLESQHCLANTLLIITGDHGEAFGEHNEFGHALFCYEENLRVPLIFSNPEIFPEPLQVSCRANLIDIMPTVLELFADKIPSQLQGKSLVNLLSGGKKNNPDSQRSFYFESMHGKEEFGWAPLTGMLKDNHKFISLPDPELYDLNNDKKERNNLFWKQNRFAKELDKELMNLAAGYTKTGGAQRALTEEDKKHLQSLGYISAFAAGKESGLDPKKGILVKNSFAGIDAQIDAGDMAKAEKMLTEMAQKNPDNLLPQYFGTWNKIYKKKNQ